jgi:hypothetical protein
MSATESARQATDRVGSSLTGVILSPAERIVAPLHGRCRPSDGPSDE